MQTAAPELIELSNEKSSTLKEYGVNRKDPGGGGRGKLGNTHQDFGVLPKRRRGFTDRGCEDARTLENHRLAVEVHATIRSKDLMSDHTHLSHPLAGENLTQSIEGLGGRRHPYQSRQAEKSAEIQKIPPSSGYAMTDLLQQENHDRPQNGDAGQARQQCQRGNRSHETSQNRQAGRRRQATAGHSAQACSSIDSTHGFNCSNSTLRNSTG